MIRDTQSLLRWADMHPRGRLAAADEFERQAGVREANGDEDGAEALVDAAELLRNRGGGRRDG
jgi:hypothetical protein